MSIPDLQYKLLRWFNINKRELPWRKSKDPYRIWLSEVILQQTRVDQGLNYYHKFIENHPNVKSLAMASEEEILKLWQGLGYYSRARNLHFAAKQIMADGFPKDYKSLLKLKGVGEYTAAAIASIAYDEAVAVVDGNVYRVLSRLFGIHTAIDSSAGKKEFQSLAQSILVHQQPGEWNQALMEFGALHCLPKSPNCPECPFFESCHAALKNEISSLPYKAGKVKTQNRFITYFYIQSENVTFLIKRPRTGIWGGLYEFPNVDSDRLLDVGVALKQFRESNNISAPGKAIITTAPIKHVLSHRVIHAQFVQLQIEVSKVPESWLKINTSVLQNYPVSRLMEKYISGELSSNINP